MTEVQVIRRIASNGVDEDYWQVGPNVWKARTGCVMQQWGTPKDAEWLCSTYRWRHGVFEEEVTKQANRGRTLTLIQDVKRSPVEGYRKWEQQTREGSRT